MSREKRRKWAIHLSPKEDSFLALNFMRLENYIELLSAIVLTVAAGAIIVVIIIALINLFNMIGFNVGV